MMRIFDKLKIKAAFFVFRLTGWAIRTMSDTGWRAMIIPYVMTWTSIIREIASDEPMEQDLYDAAEAFGLSLANMRGERSARSMDATISADDIDHAGVHDVFSDIADDVILEVIEAMEEHPAWPDDPIHAAAIVAEECGELTQAALDHVYPEGNHHGPDTEDRMEREAIQTAATSFRFIAGRRNGR